MSRRLLRKSPAKQARKWNKLKAPCTHSGRMYKGWKNMCPLWSSANKQKPKSDTSISSVHCCPELRSSHSSQRSDPYLTARARTLQVIWTAKSCFQYTGVTQGWLSIFLNPHTSTYSRMNIIFYTILLIIHHPPINNCSQTHIILHIRS